MAAVVDSVNLLARDIFSCLQSADEFFTLLGLFYAGKLTFSTISTIMSGIKTFVLPHCSRKVDFIQKYGKWAVVTGSTDGIGKAYARELASHGMSVILVSRNMSKLKQVAAEIERDYNVETMVVQADFSEGRPIYDKLCQQLNSKEVGMLVNNVGVALSDNNPMEFAESAEKDIWKLINVNIGAATVLCHTLLPQMVARQRGMIVNVSSAASYVPTPLIAMYSSSKIYLDYFSRALHYEYSRYGVSVQSLTPYMVVTNMTKSNDLANKPGITVPDAETFARSAVATLGWANRTSGYWNHGLQGIIMGLLPEWLQMALFYKFIKKYGENNRMKSKAQ